MGVVNASDEEESRHPSRSAAIDVDAWRQAIRAETFGGYHLAMGVAIEREGNADAAAACYRRAIEANPAQTEAHFRLVTLLERIHDDGAATARAQALAVNPLFETDGACRIAFSLLETGDTKTAVPYLERCLASKPDHGEGLVCFGLCRLLEGAWAEAETHFAAARVAVAARAESLADLCWSIGRRLRVDGAVEAALAALRQAVKLAPGEARYHAELAAILEMLNRAEDAVESFDEAVRLDPSLTVAHLRKGELLVRLGRLQEGMAALQRGIDLDPQAPLAHAFLGTALLNAGSFEEALVELRKGEALDAKTPYTINRCWLAGQLAMTLGALDRHAEVEAVVRSAPLNDPGVVFLDVFLERAFLAQGRIDDAERVLQKLKTNPTPPLDLFAHAEGGMILLAKGQVDEAVAECRRAVAAYPTHPCALVNLGIALHAKGSSEEAKEVFRTALASSPENVVDVEVRTRPLWARRRADEVLGALRAEG